MEKPKDTSQGILADFFSKPKPVAANKEENQNPPPTLTIRRPTSIQKEGFRRIKCRYPFPCSGGCGRRYPIGTMAFWKRTRDEHGAYRTQIVCEGCWRNSESE